MRGGADATGGVPEVGTTGVDCVSIMGGTAFCANDWGVAFAVEGGVDVSMGGGG